VRPRAELAGDVIAGLRTAGLRVLPVNAWDDVDATIVGSTLVVGELTTSAHPEGWQQLRITSRIRVRRVSGVAAAVAALTVLAWPLAVVAAVIGVAEIARGWSAVSRTAWRELLSGDRPVPDDPSAPPAAARTVLDLDREARRAGDVEEMVPR
jgi:hypothetical protein